MKNIIEAKEIAKTPITCYRTVNDKQGINTTLDQFIIKLGLGVKDLISQLRSITDEVQQKQFKTFNIPCATISIVAGEDKSALSIKSKNNIIAIDIDEKENPYLSNETMLINTGYRLFNLPYVYLVSRSCRGKGLFVIIPVENIDNIKGYFNKIREDFKKMNIVIDAQCCNINRLRFASYDDKTIQGEWRKEGNTPIEIFDEILEDDNQETYTSNFAVKTAIQANSLLLDDLFIIKALMMLVKDYGYTSDDYSSWLNDGFRLATLGEQMGLFLFIMISRNSRGYKNDSDVKRKFEECIRHTKFDRTCLAYYFGVLKKKIGTDWVKAVQDFQLPNIDK